MTCPLYLVKFKDLCFQNFCYFSWQTDYINLFANQRKVSDMTSTPNLDFCSCFSSNSLRTSQDKEVSLNLSWKELSVSILLPVYGWGCVGGLFIFKLPDLFRYHHHQRKEKNLTEVLFHFLVKDLYWYWYELVSPVRSRDEEGSVLINLVWGQSFKVILVVQKDCGQQVVDKNKGKSENSLFYSAYHTAW